MISQRKYTTLSSKGLGEEFIYLHFQLVFAMCPCCGPQCALYQRLSNLTYKRNPWGIVIVHILVQYISESLQF